MAIIKAQVPTTHLATTVGDPNHLIVEYSTDILLPVPGPYLMGQIRRDFEKAVLKLNDFLLFARDTKMYLGRGGDFELKIEPQFITPRSGDISGYGQFITPAANFALQSNQIRTDNSRIRSQDFAINNATYSQNNPQGVLLSRMAAPNNVFRELYDAQIIGTDKNILGKELMAAKKFEEELEIIIQPLLDNRKQSIPEETPCLITDLATQVLSEVHIKNKGFLRQDFNSLNPNMQKLVTNWMVASHVDARAEIPEVFQPNLIQVFGFKPNVFVREWAFNRKERSTLTFGTPDLRGPVATEPVAPEGTYKREDYISSQTESISQRRDLRRRGTTEADQFGSSTLRRSLDKVYYSGAGALDQLTSQASNSLLREERRSTILSIIREWSEENETQNTEVVRSFTSSTITRDAVGVDPKLAANLHRLNVVMPVGVKVEMYDVGLTWAPRIFNPFFDLRQAIDQVYTRALNEHLQRYYVPVPTRPPIVFDTYTASTSFLMEGEERATEDFSLTLQPSDREQRPDLDNARVTWNQDESFWNDDPDHFVAVLENLSFSGRTISGRVRLETDDGGADFEGSALVEVPILRYSQETVNALAQYELDLDDASQRREALQAQAKQYARVKQREFIEQQESLLNIQKIVFESLIKFICTNTVTANLSYFKEIIYRTIDWTNAKMEFESVAFTNVVYPDFPPDHFTNSLSVRFFLPIIREAEEVLFDTLEACGSLQVRESVENARNRIDQTRDRLETNGPEILDEFETEMVIGQHIEPVMSNHDMKS